MALQELPVGGRQALAADEKIPVEAAIIAYNCVMDDDTIRGRNGYLSVAAAAIGSGAAPQGLWRFRPANDIAACIAVGGGNIYKVDDPSSDTASDASVTTLASATFASTDTIVGVQLGRYLYLGNNASVASWVRVNPDFTITSILALTRGETPTSTANGTLTIVGLHALSPAFAGGAGRDTVFTDWDRITDGAAGVCPVAGSVTYTLTTAISGVDNSWLQVFCTPPTQQAGGGQVKIEVATASGSFESLGTIVDGQGAGAPNILWCNLNQLTSTTLASIKKIRFTLLSASGYFGVYGLLYIPVAPAAGDQQYNVTFKDSVTGQRSLPTDNVTVTFTSDGVTIPQYHSVYGDRSTLADEGTKGSAPDVVPYNRNGNVESGLAYPDKSVYAPVATIAGTIPTGDRYPTCDTVELWRLTDTGWRIVKTVTLASSLTTTYSITDDTGSSTSSHELYKAGGPPPGSNAAGAFAGRLITGQEQRMSGSSFEPFAATTGTDPYPQFPAIPTIDADGFAFDIAPSPREQIQATVAQESGADLIYTLTNEGTYIMSEFTPNVEEGGAQSVPYRIFNRGVVSRTGWCFAENMLFWCAYDGIYFAANRTLVDELSKPIRRLVNDWFQPSSSVVMWYRKRKLYVSNGTKYLRYDFVKQRWSEGVLSHTPRYAASWHQNGDTGSDIKQVTDAIVFHDSFTGTLATDLVSHTPEVGSAWAVHPVNTGGVIWQLTGSTPPTAAISINNNPGVYYNTTVLPTDVSAQTSIYYHDTANDDTAILLRASATLETWYAVQFHSTDGLVKLERRNAGAVSALANVSYATFFGSGTPTNTTFAVEARIVGNVVTVYSNGVAKLTYTDTSGSAILTAGFVGLRASFARAAPAMQPEGLTVYDFKETASSLNSITGEQTWLYLSSGKIVRWSEAYASDDGTVIPDWIYSTGYMFSPVRFTIDTLFGDVTGNCSVNAYRSSDTSNTRRVELIEGEQEIGGLPDFQGYKARLQFTAPNGTQLRRFAWSLGGNDGIGA